MNETLNVNIVAMFTLNPLTWLGGVAKETLAEGFTAMMVVIWSVAMWLLKSAFALIDSFTPNVADPDLNGLYSVILWIAGVIAVVVAIGQIALGALRQDGRGLGIVVAGVGKYGAILACWISVSAGFIAAASGLTKGILEAGLGVTSFSGYAAGDGFVDTVAGTTQAGVLGMCGLVILIPAAFGHMIIMMVRSAALLILVATMPLSAAGALSEGTMSWMWKSIRWFVACVLMEPLLALVLGIGTQFAWAGMPDGESTVQIGSLRISSTAENIGMSVVGSIILLIACFMPLFLFRLLAFVDPGTASGSSFRSTMKANGGVSGLIRSKTGGGQEAAPGAATETASDGRTSSENGAEAETANRYQASLLKNVGGIAGGAVAKGMETAGKIAQAGAETGVDVLGQAGIGNQGHYPTDHPTGHSATKKNQHKPSQGTKPSKDTKSGSPQQAKDVVEEDPEILLA